MSTPIPEGLGKCGICLRTVHQTDAISSVLRGYPPRAYICHKDCKDALEAKNGPEPQLTQTDYMKLAPELEAVGQDVAGISMQMSEDLHTALKEDFGEFIATAVTGTGEPISSERQGTAEPATEADEQALRQAYGKSREELAEEAEQEYDISHLVAKNPPVSVDVEPEEVKLQLAAETPSSEPSTPELPKIPIPKKSPAKKAPPKKGPAKTPKVTVTPPGGITQIVPGSEEQSPDA